MCEFGGDCTSLLFSLTCSAVKNIEERSGSFSNSLFPTDTWCIPAVTGRGKGRDEDNEGEVCEALPVSGVPGHYLRGPLRAQTTPHLPRAFRTEATFKHGHYVESADIVTAYYQSLAPILEL